MRKAGEELWTASEGDLKAVHSSFDFIVRFNAF